MCKVCIDCGILKPDSDFDVSYNQCKMCKAYWLRLKMLDPYQSAKRRIINYRNTDRLKGLECDLDQDYVDLLVETSCYYCNSGSNNEVLGYDRIDNNKGHTKDNVIVCCHRCNVARNDLYTVEEFTDVGLGISKSIYKKRLKELKELVTGFYDMTWYDAINEHLGEYYYV